MSIPIRASTLNPLENVSGLAARLAGYPVETPAF
jgi:hypothetical protein